MSLGFFFFGMCDGDEDTETGTLAATASLTATRGHIRRSCSTNPVSSQIPRLTLVLSDSAGVAQASEKPHGSECCCAATGCCCLYTHPDQKIKKKTKQPCYWSHNGMYERNLEPKPEGNLVDYLVEFGLSVMLYWELGQKKNDEIAIFWLNVVKTGKTKRIKKRGFKERLPSNSLIYFDTVPTLYLCSPGRKTLSVYF